MDDEIETLVLKVRADTQGFARDVDTMSRQLDGPLQAGMDRAGSAMESALNRFIRTGKFGFEDLKRTVLSVMNEIAASTLRMNFGSAGGGSGGIFSTLASVAMTAFGLPGRATGGPVSPGQAYLVGERGPEMFVPTASGRIETGAGRGATTINVTVNAPADASPAFMAKSGRQVARAVRQALLRAEGR
ncbi:MAG: tail tape measure protein [Sphingosinicella sp.]|nr:tail tape measure protein [Sphingosinicella sp.]